MKNPEEFASQVAPGNDQSGTNSINQKDVPAILPPPAEKTDQMKSFKQDNKKGIAKDDKAPGEKKNNACCCTIF